MSEPIATEEQITPGWLTNILQRNGHLVHGRVSAIKKECFKTLFSLFYRLEAFYSDGAIPALPSKMLLKLPLPNNEASLRNGRTYLIDLAYMMALQWYPERRALMEESLLKHYHSSLLSFGVKGYAWEDCREDYRYSVISHLFIPVLQRAGGQIPATVWWHNFERISEAYKDLKCYELL